MLLNIFHLHGAEHLQYSLLPLLFSLAGAAFKAFQGIRQNAKANQIHPQQATYNVSPYAQNNLGLANNLFNARMAGAGTAAQNILGAQGNTIAGINRNATNSAQALATIAGTQGQTDADLSQLAGQEGQYKLNTAGLVTNANQGMTNELDKVYQDQVRKYQEDVAAKTALRQSGMSNIYGAIGNAGMALTGLGLGKTASGPSASHNIPGLATPPYAPPNTGAIPLPGMGSMRMPFYNAVSGRWE